MLVGAVCAEVSSHCYKLVNADLRDVTALERKLVSVGVVPSAPTLFLSECVLVYIEPEESGAVIQWAARTFPTACFLTYEQVHPHDAFGQIMMRHLEVRGLGGLRVHWMLCPRSPSLFADLPPV
jgi:O-methyltransferase involved in polyketide biosynthesis